MTPASLQRVLPAEARLVDGDGGTSVALVDVTHDHRSAGPGVLFAARPGRRADGHEFAPLAVAAGAPAVLVERPLDVPVPQLIVPDVAAVLGTVASAVHGHPSRALRLVGITGTNGKTTTAYLLEAAFRAAGDVTGLIGTVETVVGDLRVAGVRTTPEATELQRLLADMRRAGIGSAVMEVSSHGLALGRVNGTAFAVAVFTNLTQDHLDFHPDLEAYFAAKATLFDARFSPVAVINTDDRWGARLAELARTRGTEVVPLSPSGRPDAYAKARDVRMDRTGATFVADVGDEPVRVQVGLPGRFNVANALTAVTAASVAGIDLATAAAGVATVAGVPGRMERVDVGQTFTVVVDYAHTPDSVAHVLRAAWEITAGRVLVVVGCGGDRDRSKRPLMGRAAAAGADVAFLTSDNPRSEDPAAILAEMSAGAAGVPDRDVRVEPDRATAIEAALRVAHDGDVVVIAGKGHETSQELADRTVAFDDRAVAREALRRLGRAAR